VSTTLTGRERLPVAPRRLWAGLLLAPSAWLVAELLGYVLTARVCDRASTGSAMRAGVAQDFLAFGLGVIALVGLTIAMGNWQRVRNASDTNESAVRGRERFMSLAGITASALFVLGIVFFALPPLLVNVCHQAH